MRRQCQSLEIDVQEVDLARQPALEDILAAIAQAQDDLCLIVGSPVYVSHAVPLVTDFIAHLPVGTHLPVVPFGPGEGLQR